MRKIFYAAMLGVLLPLTAAMAQPAEAPQRLINTNGQATVYATPDKVTVYFGVETYNRDLDQARQVSDTNSASLLAAIKGMGIEDKDVQTSYMNVELVYENNNGQPLVVLQGYRTVRTYAVTLRNIKQFSDLVDTALKNGANRLDGFTYDTDELRQYRDEARILAIHAAKEKATALCKELDCKPGRPMSINENDEWASPMSNTRAFAGAAIATASQQTMPAGQIPIVANVSVSFEILDSK